MINQENERLKAFAGWLPAVILPTATFLQLKKMWFVDAEGVDPITWGLFGIANLGAYIFTNKYKSPQAIIAFLLSAILDFIIVVLCLI